MLNENSKPYWSKLNVVSVNADKIVATEIEGNISGGSDASSIQGVDVSTTQPTQGQSLKYLNGMYIPTPDVVPSLQSILESQLGSNNTGPNQPIIVSSSLTGGPKLDLVSTSTSSTAMKLDAHFGGILIQANTFDFETQNITQSGIGNDVLIEKFAVKLQTAQFTLAQGASLDIKVVDDSVNKNIILGNSTFSVNIMGFGSNVNATEMLLCAVHSVNILPSPNPSNFTIRLFNPGTTITNEAADISIYVH